VPLVNIPGVGGVNFPDSMSPDEVNQASAKLHSEANQPAAQAAAESQLSIPAEMPDVARMEEARKKAFPSPYEQEQELKSMADRNQQAFLSGAASLPIGIAQAFRQNEQQALAPLNQEAQRQGLQPQPTLTDQALAQLPSQVSNVVNFAPQNLSETALQVGGGLLAPENMLLGLSEAVPKYRQAFEPLETAIIPKDVARNFDSPAVQGALKDELKGLLSSQAKYEKQVAISAAPKELTPFEQAFGRAEPLASQAKPVSSATDLLRENLIRQEQIKQAVVDNKVVVHSKVDWDRMFGSTSTPEVIHAEALARAKQVDQLVEQGMVPADKAGQLRVAVYQETLGANGIKPVSEKMSKYNILGELFRYGQIQKKTGVPTGDTAQNFVFTFTKASNNLAEQKGIISEIVAPLKNKDSLVSDLQYFRTQADGSVQFDPSALYVPGKVNIPATVKQFTPEEAQVLSQLRGYLDATADRLNVPKLPGYIPIREVSSDVMKSSIDSTLNPALLRARTSGEFIPGAHETDFFKLMDRYLRETNKAEFIAPALDEGIATLNQLRLSGLPKEAEVFKKYMIDMFHLDGEKEVAQLFGAHLLKANREDIAAFVKMLPDPDSAMKQISDAGTRGVYVNLVGTNPASITKQYMQGPMIGSIELGPTWAASGMKDSLDVFTKAGKERIASAKKILKASLADNFQQLDEQFSNAPTNQIAKAIDFINKPGAFVAKHTMGAGEVANRLGSVLGAENKWNYYWQNGGSTSIQKLLSQSALTTAQKSLVSKSFMSGGMENARDIYALLMAQRINFTYSMADKPELMRSTLGQMFPFTTYTRNILARAAEAVAEGKPMDLAKQIITPLLFMTGFTALTGYNLPRGSYPMSGALDLIERGITPTPLIIAKDPFGTITPLPKNSLKKIMTGTFDPRKELAKVKEKKFPFTKHKPGVWFP